MNIKIFRYIFLITFSLFVHERLLGQWTKKINNLLPAGVHHVQTSDSNIFLYRSPISQDDLEIINIDSNGDFNWSTKVTRIGYNLNSSNQPSTLGINVEPFITLKNGASVVSRIIRNVNTSKFSLVYVNQMGEAKWEKEITHNINFSEPPRFIQLNQNSFYAIGFSRTNNFSNRISIMHFSLAGELLFEKQLVDANEQETDLYNYVMLDEGRLAIIKSRLLSDKGSVVTIFDKNMNYLESFETNLLVSQIFYQNGCYYLAGEPSPFDLFDSKATIARIGEDFSPLWVRQVNGSLITALYSIRLIENKLFLKSFSRELEDSFITKLSLDGEIIDQVAIQSSPTIPTITFNSFQNNSLIDYQSIDGNIAVQKIDLDLVSSCFFPRVCVDIPEKEISVERLNENIFDPLDLDVSIIDLKTEVVYIDVELEDICFEPDYSFPIPYFITDDTVCINEQIEMANLQNEMASDVSWSAPGSNLEYSADANPGLFSYSEPGIYTITQSIVFEGCTSEFSQEIVVAAPIQLPFDETINLCEPQDFLIDTNHSNVLSYQWQDGSIEPTFLTTTEGNYTVRLEDKHCVQEVIFQVNYLDFDTLSTSLGADTTICSQLPIAINPGINPELDFQWTDGHPNLDRLVSESGRYTLITTLGECSTSSTIIVEVEDCSFKIFIPNVFSPNDDGINDTIYPLGQQLELLEFKIYDKWGNEVHNQLEPWDGMVRSKKGHLGVYVYSALILNTKLGTQELLQGDFTLVR